MDEFWGILHISELILGLSFQLVLIPICVGYYKKLPFLNNSTFSYKYVEMQFSLERAMKRDWTRYKISGCEFWGG